MRMQVYELERFRVVHASRYAAPVLSLGLAPNCALLAVGLADGDLLVRRHSHNRGAAPGLPGARRGPAHARLLGSICECGVPSLAPAGDSSGVGSSIKPEVPDTLVTKRYHGAAHARPSCMHDRVT